MGSFTDESSATDSAGSQPAGADQLQNPQRRRFSRNTLAGGAVLLTLGNRPAWGQTIGCMSVPTLNSFDPTTGMFLSAPAGRPEHDINLATEIHRISDPEDNYLGTDGTYSTCQDTTSPDRVCLVIGECPPE